MTKMVTINSLHIDIDDLNEFIDWFNYHIDEYGAIRVADVMEVYFSKNWATNYITWHEDCKHGWTEKINAKDHFKIIYGKYGSRLPYFRLKLPKYKCLEERV